jgi:death-on-curing protein
MTPAEEPRFLSVDEALVIHTDQIERYGGAAGLRDLGLLQSALAVPDAGFGETRLHGTLEEMGAAYLFHIAQNHPFIDGNERTATAAMLVFLRLNGLTLTLQDDDLEALTLKVASGLLQKAEVAVVIGANVERFEA